MVLLKMMNTRYFFFLFIIVFSFSISLIGQASNQNIFKFSQLLYNLDNYYVNNVNDTTLTESAIKAVLKNLDPHSLYYTEKEIKKMEEPLEGKFDGVGIQFNILNDTLLVVSPLPGGPSEKIGILAGDKIIKVDSTSVAGVGLTNRDVFKYLRGKKGTKVELEILRGDNTYLSFTVTRAPIPIHSVVTSYIINKDIGYIKIVNFSKKTIAEFDKAIVKLKKQGLKKLIVDLQNNGGGYLNVAVRLASKFIESNKLVVYTKGVNSPKKYYNSISYNTNDSTLFRGNDNKLVILINEASASASEILSGAIQDHDRGIIVGRRSFGKGLVQKTFKFIDNSVMRLTVSKYYTPSGRCIQKSYNEGLKSYRNELNERVKSGEIYGKPIHDSIPDSLKFNTLVKKRIVYGGGGITPDIFVGIDTTFYTKSFGKINRKGYLSQFSLNYLNKKRKKLKSKYPTINDFIKKMKFKDEIYPAFLSFLDKEKVEYSKKELETSFKVIELRIKSSMANSLYRIEDSYKIINELNDPLAKAINILTKE